MIRAANILKAFRQAWWILLLALYGASALKIDSFHALFHPKELAELHSPEQENNPCHQRVYHQQTEKGCEHKAHITENTKCPLCEYKVTPDQLVESELVQARSVSISGIRIIWYDAVSECRTISIPARGPPANV